MPAAQCAGFAIADGEVYSAAAAVGVGGDTLVLTAAAKSSGLRVLNTSADYPVAQFENGLGRHGRRSPWPRRPSRWAPTARWGLAGN